MAPIIVLWRLNESIFLCHVSWMIILYSQMIPVTTASTAAAAKSLQSCPTLCNPIDGSPPGSPIPGILQARILEWVAISFSNAWQWKVKVKSLSHVQLLVTPWTVAYQAPLSMGFPRQEYWSGVPLPSPRMSPGTCHLREEFCGLVHGAWPFPLYMLPLRWL